MAQKLRLSPPDDWNEDEEKKAELTEHLAELRTRIIRSVVYALAGMAVMYFLYYPVYNLLAAPINQIIDERRRDIANSGVLPPFAYTNFAEPFFMMLQIVMIGGLVLALPFIVMEAWGFIAPALTPTEKRGVHFVAPMSVILFILGVTCAYLVLRPAVHWFLSYLPANAVLLQNPMTYIVFAVKMLLVFGLIFQLPVVLMFLGKVGIITSALMIKYWRHIAVGLFTVSMVVAPSNDPGTMLALAVPLTLLFFASIALVKMVEPKDKAADG